MHSSICVRYKCDIVKLSPAFLLMSLSVFITETGGRKRSQRKGQRRRPRATAAPGGLEASAGERHPSVS